MKVFIYTSGVFFIFFCMLCFPHIAASGAGKGLLLWYQVLIPTLLPFMMISRLLVKSNILYSVSPILTPIIGRLFGTTGTGAYCILIGFLCGYPMGAKIICDLYEENAFSKEHAEYLLFFCNNVSPGFISGFVITSCLKKPELLIPSFMILYGVPIFSSFIYRAAKKQQPAANQQQWISHVTSNTKIKFYDLNDMIMNSLGAMVNLGGYVVIFSFISEFVKAIPVNSASMILLKNLLGGILEITSGISEIADSGRNPGMNYSLIILITSFGGISGIAQTSGIIGKHFFSIKKYTFGKMVQALLSGLLAYGYIVLNSR